ncbi:MAG: DUF502 domain-containing protein [Candidatus Bipolaricaulota bacterium]|nr:DUF502 domain-containing protein [Candidatus Bipolaricaulota bacterium]
MRRVGRWLRRTFVSGLLVLGPLALCLYLLWLLYRLAYAALGPHTAFAELMRRVLGRYVPGTEVVVTVLFILLVGAVARHWVGRGVLRGVERVVRAVPGVRNLYWGARQLVRVMLEREGAVAQGRRIVLVEFPQPGCHVLGFLTNEEVPSWGGEFSPDTVAVYIPTAPNPLSGWVLFVPRSKVTPVDLTAEEALSLILSGGLVVQPPGEGELRGPEPPGQGLDRGKGAGYK